MLLLVDILRLNGTPVRCTVPPSVLAGAPREKTVGHADSVDLCRRLAQRRHPQCARPCFHRLGYATHARDGFSYGRWPIRRHVEGDVGRAAGRAQQD